MSATKPAVDAAFDPGRSRFAPSAVLLGTARMGPGSVAAQGTVIRSVGGAVAVGAGSMVLENSVVVGRPGLPTTVGRRTVFGHRCLVVGATVGDLCEIGNGTILMPGARIGDRCFFGEGALVPRGAVVPDGAVVVGRPGRAIRTATGADLDNLRALRGGDLNVPAAELETVSDRQEAGPAMGQMYAYKDKTPSVAPDAVLFDSAEVTGDVVIGAGSIVGSGVRIIGDSHGPVRIGARVQILENTVLHLLPDNELVIDDDVVVGPGAMIHGCRIGAGSVVEPGAIVCDNSVLGRNSTVAAGAVVKQRSSFPDGAVVDGFPAKQIGTNDGPPGRPGWAIAPEDLATIARVRRDA